MNANNLLFSVVTGDVFVLDVDNLVRMQERVYVTTPETTAPELMLQTAPVSVNTDLFGLGVNLFLLLFVNHPLYGKRVGMVTPETRLEHEAKNPLFIFDPKDDSNRPGELEQAAAMLWPTAPQCVRDLFTRAFTAGLKDPEARVRKSEWSKLFSTVFDWIVRCDKCNCEFIVDLSGKTPKLPSARCSCFLTGALRRLRTSDKELVVFPGKDLAFKNIAGNSSQVLGKVESHPRKPEVVGITNKSTEAWSATRPDGRTTFCKPNQTIELRPGLTLTLNSNSVAVDSFVS